MKQMMFLPNMRISKRIPFESVRKIVAMIKNEWEKTIDADDD